MSPQQSRGRDYIFTDETAPDGREPVAHDSSDIVTPSGMVANGTEPAECINSGER